MHACMYVCIRVCIYMLPIGSLYMLACIYSCMYVSMYVYTRKISNLCTGVRMYTCGYVHTCIHTCSDTMRSDLMLLSLRSSTTYIHTYITLHYIHTCSDHMGSDRMLLSFVELAFEFYIYIYIHIYIPAQTTWAAIAYCWACVQARLHKASWLCRCVIAGRICLPSRV